jgi:sulfate permease, SulP family
LVSQGVADLASGVVGALPVGASFSRSALSHQAGAGSRWCGAFTGAIVLAFLPFAGIVEELPRAVLGAIVIAAVLGLFRPVAIWRMALDSPPQGIVAAGTLVATLIFSPHVERAVVLGVGFAVVVHLWREVQITVDHHFDGPTVTIEPKGVFWFGVAHRIEQMVVNLLAARPDLTVVVVDLHGIGRIDYTAALVLRRLVDSAAENDVELLIANIPPQAVRILGALLGGRAGVPER